MPTKTASRLPATSGSATKPSKLRHCGAHPVTEVAAEILEEICRRDVLEHDALEDDSRESESVSVPESNGDDSDYGLEAGTEELALRTELACGMQLYGGVEDLFPLFRTNSFDRPPSGSRCAKVDIFSRHEEFSWVFCTFPRNMPLKLCPCAACRKVWAHPKLPRPTKRPSSGVFVFSCIRNFLSTKYH